MARSYLVPGFGVVNETTGNDYLIPGFGAVNETQSGGSALSVTPDVGSIVFTGFAPAVTFDIVLTPSAGSILFTGFAPSVGTDLSVAPGVGSVVLTGFAPGLTLGTTVLPGAGSVVFTGFAPVVDGGVSNTDVFPDVGLVLFSGFAPEITGADVPNLAGGAADISRRKWLDHQDRKRQQRLETHGTKKKYQNKGKRSAVMPLVKVAEQGSSAAILELPVLPVLSIEASTYLTGDAIDTGHSAPVPAAEPDRPTVWQTRADAEAQEQREYIARIQEIERQRYAEELQDEEDLEIMLMGA